MPVKAQIMTQMSSLLYSGWKEDDPSPGQHFSTLRPSGSACQHGGCAAFSALQPELANPKAEMLTSEGVSLSVLTC